MKINVKTKIKYNGQEYSSPNELPPEARSAYEAAIASSAGATAAATKKIVFNGQEYSSAEQMPAGERQLYEDAIKLARDSATVARSQSPGAGWLTK